MSKSVRITTENHAYSVKIQFTSVNNTKHMVYFALILYKSSRFFVFQWPGSTDVAYAQTPFNPCRQAFKSKMHVFEGFIFQNGFVHF